MEYTPLTKLFYKDKQTYEEKYQQRISCEDCLYLLPVCIGKYQAFVLSTREVTQLVQKIYHRNNKLTRIVNSDMLPPVAIKDFIKEALVQEIMLSNDIEGVYSSRKELHLVLKNDNPQKKLRFEGMVRHYNKILESDIPLYHSQDIRILYDDILLPEIETGKKPDGQVFRKDCASVFNEFDKEIHRGIMPEESLINFMDNSLNWLNDKSIPQIIRIAVFHYLLGYRHPFYDGNGRLSRFITSYLLKETLNILVSHRISYVISNHKKDYYQAFKTCSSKEDRGDLTPFVITFLEFVYEAVESLIQELTDASAKLEHYDDILARLSESQNKTKINILYVSVQNSLFSNEPLTIGDLKNISEKSETCLRSYLKELEHENLIIKAKDGHFVTYTANLDAIDQL